VSNIRRKLIWPNPVLLTIVKEGIRDIGSMAIKDKHSIPPLC
jgi:hypothetical protein